MTKKQLEDMVFGIKKPNLKESEVRLLLNKEDNLIKPISKAQPVAQAKPQSVAQVKPQRVAQAKPQLVAQAVAQGSWVAQEGTQKVAQDRPQRVAQAKSQQVVQAKSQQVARVVSQEEKSSIRKYVDELKDQISKINGVENKKKFVRGIGWGIMTIKTGKQTYLRGVKKLGGKKEVLYIGNATN